MSKDLFSTYASDYAKYRPGYPQELVDFLVTFVEGRERAWDCATGNGQAALLLARHFPEVFATDLSADQIAAAPPHPRVRYSIAPAEQTSFPDKFFDLITIAQAYHWVDHGLFSREAGRVGKSGSILAVWGYNLFRAANAQITKLVDQFYSAVTEPYWEPERKYLDNNYATAPFYFEELPVRRSFKMQTRWTIEEVSGYLNTWSAIKKFIRVNGFNPVDDLTKQMKAVWGNESHILFDFPLALRIGRIH